MDRMKQEEDRVLMGMGHDRTQPGPVLLLKRCASYGRINPFYRDPISLQLAQHYS